MLYTIQAIDDMYVICFCSQINQSAILSRFIFHFIFYYGSKCYCNKFDRFMNSDMRCSGGSFINSNIELKYLEKSH